MIQPDYDSMTYRRCGNSGVHLPAISLGLWHNFGTNDDQDVARELILNSFEAGLVHFDLANNYGPPPGSAEETFGRILKQDLSSHRDELLISTKAGFEMWDGPYGNFGSRKHLLSSLDQSLDRMGLEYVDIFYHHRRDPHTPVEESMSALATAVTSGKALYVGISNYLPEYAEEAFRILNEWKVPCLIHQFRTNILQPGYSPELFPVLNTYGVGGIAFSPLAQGLLSGKYLDGIPENSRMALSGFLQEKALDEPTVEAIRNLSDVADQCGRSLAQLALACLLEQPEITSVLIGVSRVDQLENNLEILRQPPLPGDVLEMVRNICSQCRQAQSAS